MSELKTRLQGRFLPYLLAMSWTIFLSILLLQPENQPIIPTGIQPAPPSLGRELLFSIVHIVTMATTAILWCFALNINKKSHAVILVIILVAYGVSVEYLQGNVAGRTAQWSDMLANSIGIGLGFWLWYSQKSSSKLEKLLSRL